MTLNNHNYRFANALRRMLVPVGITLLTVGHALGAQTRFAQRDTVPDLSKYVTLEDCEAGVQRLMRTTELRLPYWPDSMELTGKEHLNPVPADVRDFAAKCSENLRPDSADLKHFSRWMGLYLTAEKKEIVTKIADRKLSAGSWNADDTLNFLAPTISRMLGVYSRPLYQYHGDLSISLIDRYLDSARRPTSIKELSALYSGKARYYMISGDTAKGVEWYKNIVSLLDSASPTGKDSEYLEKQAPSVIAAAKEVIQHAIITDSLKVSGQAYAKFRNEIWKNVTNGPAVEYIKMIGQIAKPLVGDFMYSSDGKRISNAAGISTNTSNSFPSAGKVSLVVFLYGGCRSETMASPRNTRPSFKGMCLDSYAMLKRMKDKYPDLDIVIVSKTNGFVGDLGPFEPEQEADTLRWLWLEKHKLPATLIIEETEFFRLRGLDRRRIDIPNENSSNYTYLTSQRASSDMAPLTLYIVDSDGTILETAFAMPSFEPKLKVLLDVIMKREK